VTRILFVCEGNICRSPFAERVLRMNLKGSSKAQPTVASAGLNPPVGATMAEETASLLDRLGAKSEGHRPRMLSVDDLENASLVLAATRSIRGRIVNFHPQAVQYTFTLRQLGHSLARAHPTGPQPVAGESPTERLDAVVHLAQRYRGLAQHRDADDDVVDPYTQPMKVHLAAASQMLPAINLLSLTLGGKSVPVPKDLVLSTSRGLRARLTPSGRRSWR
jgi:protein-tyrosine phosphatase